MKEDEAFRELQILEHNLNNLALQRQAFDMELSETKESLKEISSSGDEMFKVVGKIMIKKDKESLIEELSERERLLNLRLKSISEQEQLLLDKAEMLRDSLK